MGGRVEPQTLLCWTRGPGLLTKLQCSPGSPASAASPAFLNLSSNSFKLIIPVQTERSSKLRHSGLSQAPERTDLIFTVDLIGGSLWKMLLLAISCPLSSTRGSTSKRTDIRTVSVLPGKFAWRHRQRLGGCSGSSLTCKHTAGGSAQLQHSDSHSLPKPPFPRAASQKSGLPWPSQADLFTAGVIHSPSAHRAQG